MPRMFTPSKTLPASPSTESFGYNTTKSRDLGEPQTVTELDSLARLLAAAAKGDRQAFGRIYQLSSGRLFAVALRITRRRELAEEVLQEAYVTIWHKAHQYYPDRGAPMAWMTTIVRNRAIDHLRRRPREDQELDQEAPGDIDAWFDGAAADVRGCLAVLPGNQRQAILLAYYYGMTHEELALQMSAPLGTVKSWVRRGLSRLRECYEA